MGMEARVVGLPGFMETRPKWIVPPSERSIVGLRRSSSPMDTPPVVIRTSATRKLSRNLLSRCPALLHGKLASAIQRQ